MPETTDTNRPKVLRDDAGTVVGVQWETRTDWDYIIGQTARDRRNSQEAVSALTRLLHGRIREARREGFTLQALSDCSGLSIAQVQRICDLSKDRTATFPQEADLGELKYKEEKR